MRQQNANILSNEQVSDRYWHMTVETERFEPAVVPGQFFHVRVGEHLYPLLRRPFSVYRIDPDNRRLEFLYLVKGLGTRKMTGLKRGDVLDILGPLGNGFHLEAASRAILLLGRGVGIATLAALAFKAAAERKRVFAIVSARSRNDLLAADELARIGAKVYKVTDEEGTSAVEHVERIIRQILETENIDALYTCGSKRLSRLIQRLAMEKQIPGEIALEEHMGCGLGVCYACVCPVQDEGRTVNARVCVDGPVFPVERVVLR